MEWTVAIGVDTHKECTSPSRSTRWAASSTAARSRRRLRAIGALLSWAQELGVPAFAIEGTGSYGAGLVRFLERAGVGVYECERPRRQERRRGKNDLIDAALAARRLLAARPEPSPRRWSARGPAPALARAPRRDAGAQRRPQPAERAGGHRSRLRERLGALSGERLARAAARLRPRAEVINGVLRRLGQRVERLSSEVAEAERALAALVAEVAPGCSRSAASGPSAARSCSSPAATPAG